MAYCIFFDNNIIALIHVACSKLKKSLLNIVLKV